MRGGGCCVVQKKSELVGPFFIEFNLTSGKHLFDIEVNNRGAIDKENVEAGKLLDFLRTFQIPIIYVRDDRSVYTNIPSIDKAFHPKSAASPEGWLELAADSKIYRSSNFAQQSAPKSGLLVAADLLHTWLLSQVITSGRDGQFDVNRVFFETVKALAEVEKIKPYSYSKKKLADQLQDLRAKSKLITKYGLSPGVDFDELHSMVNACSSSRVRSLGQIIDPYLNSLLALYSKLGPVANVIDTFVSEISEFFDNITLNYETNKGFHVNAWNGNEISIENLSSGQRQLFFIFACAALVKSEDALMLIDEPEISLNIKWQRRLIPSLRRLIGRDSVQVVSATHSFEILAAHKDLVNVLGGKNAS